MYESEELSLDSDIKNLIILIPQIGNDTNVRKLNVNLPEEITIVEGTKVTWLNTDPIYSHNLMVEQKETGMQLFSDINIEYGQTSEFEFKNDGTYVYSYPRIPAVSGIIKVLEENVVEDNLLTSSTNPILGVGLIPSLQEDTIQERISQDDYTVSTFRVQDESEKSNQQDGSKDDLTYVMLVWAAKLFK